MNASYVLKPSVVECRSIYLIDSMDPSPTPRLTPQLETPMTSPSIFMHRCMSMHISRLTIGQLLI